MTHARKEVALYAVHFVQLHIRLRKLIDFAVEIVVHGPQFCLRIDKVAEHPVKRGGQLFEFVTRLDAGTKMVIPTPDFIADFTKVVERFDNHISHNGVECDHRKEYGGDRDGGQNAACGDDFVSSLLGRHLHLHDSQHVRLRAPHVF